VKFVSADVRWVSFLFELGNNRIVVRFNDAGGTTRGSTSVAVQTQLDADPRRGR